MDYFLRFHYFYGYKHAMRVLFWFMDEVFWLLRCLVRRNECFRPTFAIKTPLGRKKKKIVSVRPGTHPRAKNQRKKSLNGLTSMKIFQKH